MITIKKYNKTYSKQWDDFIIKSNNGTIFQLQKFLNYHITRKFNDYSLLIMQNNKIIAVMPGTVTIDNNKMSLKMSLDTDTGTDTDTYLRCHY